MPINSYLYSVPYLLVAFFLLLLYRLEKKKKSSKVPANIAFITMLIFIGLRGHLHTDFIHYYPFFEWLPTIFELDSYSFSNFEYLYEPGFIIYSSLCKTLVDNYFVWVFINTLIDLLVFRYVFKRYCTSEILPFFFLLATLCLPSNFNQEIVSKKLNGNGNTEIWAMLLSSGSKKQLKNVSKSKSCPATQQDIKGSSREMEMMTHNHCPIQMP